MNTSTILMPPLPGKENAFRVPAKIATALEALDVSDTEAVRFYAYERDMEYYRQVNSARAFYVLTGQDHTEQASKCDLCHSWVNKGAHKYWLAFGCDSGWRSFCAICEAEIERVTAEAEEKELKREGEWLDEFAATEGDIRQAVESETVSEAELTVYAQLSPDQQDAFNQHVERAMFEDEDESREQSQGTRADAGYGKEGPF